MIKCEVKNHMRPRECVWEWNTFSQVGENARDWAQWSQMHSPLW
jgi:hypothetical protein